MMQLEANGSGLELKMMKSYNLKQLMSEQIFLQINPNTFLDFLLLGYGVMWLLVFGYVVTLYVQQRNMERDIELLNRLLEEEGAASPGERRDQA